MSTVPGRAWPREEIVAALREALEIVEELSPPEDLRLQTYVSAIAGATARSAPAATVPAGVILSRSFGDSPQG